MDPDLNQTEIDRLVRAARRAAPAAAPGRSVPEVVAWDVLKAGQIGREHVQLLTSLHENFARRLSHTLGAHLRANLAATLVSAEYLRYRDFLERIPEESYLASCKLMPLAVAGVLQLDRPMAFPILDLLLGGEGSGETPTRDITEIERQILESVMRIICRELQAAWQTVAMEFAFDQRQDATTVQRLMPPDEKTLALSFEVRLAEVRGGLNVALPSLAAHALLRKMSADFEYQRPPSAAGFRETLKKNLSRCPFLAELEVAPIRASVGELASLTVGQLLVLRRPVREPATLIIAGQPAFAASVARQGERRVAHLLQRLAAQRDKEQSS
jgi:flagellar motor switch protein FliM